MNMIIQTVLIYTDKAVPGTWYPASYGVVVESGMGVLVQQYTNDLTRHV